MREPEEDRLVREVRRQVEQAKRERQLTFWDALTLVGSIGWMVVLPVLGGIVLGRWLDGISGHRPLFTLTLLLLGLGIGSLMAWRHIQEIARR